METNSQTKMEIRFEGKYKSITNFIWRDIPNFVVLTGVNGSGKSQLLDLIYKTIINTSKIAERVNLMGKIFMPNEVVYLKGEWQLHNTSDVNMFSIQQQMNGIFNNLKSGGNENSGFKEGNPNVYAACQNVLLKTGKQHNTLTREEFNKNFPEILIEYERELSQKIGEIFFNYRVSEIELKAKDLSESEISRTIGEKPWVVLREIIKESKLPFEINDPSDIWLRDSFKLKVTHQILKEEIDFNDLSSGEKVLISLVFYLYNSQEKKIFPKLLLLDEPDAHLHPSMAQQFLNVIKNVLVDKFGVQVIMTTHSPSTVILAPEGSIYEMSRIEPRIRKSPSKNHAVSLLTSGLVYVGEGTKYILVEDKDDVEFYTYIYNQLKLENQIDSNIPLVFIPASTNSKSGGNQVVKDWVNKLQGSGLFNIIQGLIDADSKNTVSEGIFKIGRYSIENYLADPILVYAVLIDNQKNPQINDLSFRVGEEYKLKSLLNINLQKIADTIFAKVEPELKNYFTDFNSADLIRVEIAFVGGQKMQYPNWLLTKRGKTILNEVYGKVFSSSGINFTTLLKAFQKINFIPKDLVDKFNEIKG